MIKKKKVIRNQVLAYFPKWQNIKEGLKNEIGHMEYGHWTSDFFVTVLIKTNKKPHSLVTPRVIEGGGICSVNKGGFNLLRQLWCRWSVQVVREPFGQKIDPPLFITGIKRWGTCRRDDGRDRTLLWCGCKHRGTCNVVETIFYSDFNEN